MAMPGFPGMIDASHGGPRTSSRCAKPSGRKARSGPPDEEGGPWETARPPTEGGEPTRHPGIAVKGAPRTVEWGARQAAARRRRSRPSTTRGRGMPVNIITTPAGSGTPSTDTLLVNPTEPPVALAGSTLSTVILVKV